MHNGVEPNEVGGTQFIEWFITLPNVKKALQNKTGTRGQITAYFEAIYRIDYIDRIMASDNADMSKKLFSGIMLGLGDDPSILLEHDCELIVQHAKKDPIVFSIVRRMINKAQLNGARLPDAFAKLAASDEFINLAKRGYKTGRYPTIFRDFIYYLMIETLVINFGLPIRSMDTRMELLDTRFKKTRPARPKSAIDLIRDGCTKNGLQTQSSDTIRRAHRKIRKTHFFLKDMKLIN